MGAAGCVAASYSSPGSPPQLAVGRPDPRSAGASWEWRTINSTAQEPYPDLVHGALPPLETQTLQVRPTCGPDIPFEAIITRPRGAPAGPAVLLIHGGPHSAFPAAYMRPFAFLAAQGYTLVAVNFR